MQPAAPITHRVQVQPIRVRTTGGAIATTFGDATQSAYILLQINRIWAQVGVRIDWLPFVDYTNNFAYQGSGSGARPQGDLSTIINSAGAPPKSANAIVLNMFFVEIVPGFPQTSDNTSNGLASLDRNGIAIHIGSNLLAFEGGRDVIAKVTAHEIGHNLGLDHYDVTSNNLMNTSGGSAEYLIASQKTTIFTDNNGVDGFDFLQPVAAATNYTQWASTNSVDLGPEGDDDADGIKNVIEFMLGLNPNASSTLPVPVRGANGLTWTLTKNAQAVADGLVYQVQSSTDLMNWANAGAAGSGSTVVTNTAGSLVVRLNSGAARRFMRLNVNSTPVAGNVATFIPMEADTEPRVFPQVVHSWTIPSP